MMGKSWKKGQKANEKAGKKRKGNENKAKKRKRKSRKSRKKIRSLAEATGHDASFSSVRRHLVGAVCATAARFFFSDRICTPYFSVQACVTPKKSNVHLSPRTLKPSQRPSSGRRHPPTKYHLPVACSSPSPNQGVTTTPASHASCGFGRCCDGGFAWASGFVQRLWWNPQ